MPFMGIVAVQREADRRPLRAICSSSPDPGIHDVSSSADRRERQLSSKAI
jgi:hypothetical protein